MFHVKFSVHTIALGCNRKESVEASQSIVSAAGCMSDERCVFTSLHDAPPSLRRVRPPPGRVVRKTFPGFYNAGWL